MKFVYPAVFKKNDEGRYTGYFPDLAQCYSSGDTLDECMDSAKEAAYDWIYLELSEPGGWLPAVSDESDLELSEDEICRNILVNIRFQDGWDE